MELDVAVIGEVTNTGEIWNYSGMVIKCAEVPVQPVSEQAPVLDRPVKNQHI